MTTMRKLAVAAAVLALGACGGAQKTSKRDMNRIAKGAEPPPKVEPGQKIERKVSREAKADFADAVKYFNEQKEAGWTPERCASAADKFESVAESHSKMVEAYFNAGVSYQMCSDDKQAEGYYKKAISINPSHAPSLANLGEIYFRGGNESVGQQYFEQAVKADPKITAARNNLAWILYTRLRKTSDAGTAKRLEDEALRHCSTVLAVDMDNVVAYTLMALIYMEGSEKNKARLRLARLLLEKGQEKDAKYAPLWNAWGLLLLREDQIAPALEKFRQAVALDPNFIEAKMNVGQIVLSFRKYQEAEEMFRQVLAAKGVDKTTIYDATVSLGVALRGQKKVDEAEQMYLEAMRMASDRGDAYYNMGLLYMDFKTNDADPKLNRDAYVKAKGYFNQYLGKRDAAGDKRKEAQDNIGDCDKTITALNQAIAQMQAAPETPEAPK